MEAVHLSNLQLIGSFGSKVNDISQPGGVNLRGVIGIKMMVLLRGVINDTLPQLFRFNPGLLEGLICIMVV